MRQDKYYNASEILFHNLKAGRADKTAVYFGEDKFTYRELAESASRFGNALADMELEKGSRVMLILLDTPNFPVCFFGAMRAGYVPVPVNTMLAESEYKFLLNDTEAAIAVVDTGLSGKILPIRNDCPELRHVILAGEENTKDKIPGILDLEKTTGRAKPESYPYKSRLDDVSFWLYSSGSTGLPKGVVHRHGSIPFNAEAYSRKVLGINENDILFSVSKVFHSYGLGNSVNFPFNAGASSVLFAGRPDAKTVFEYVDRYKPTIFFTVPTLYVAMLALPEAEKKYDLSSLRFCVSAGEAMPADIYKKWREKFGVEIVDGYGSTEMTQIFISNHPQDVKVGSCGKIVPGYRSKIVDEKGKTVLRGESGHLLVKGRSASPYYWKRPDKTAQTMRGDWVSTGDRFYQDEEGYFFYEGRSDDMFKVSGQWVSPVEVENILMGHPAIFENAVIGVKDTDKLTKIKAFIVLNENYTASDELKKDIQNFVKKKTAPYKYPRHIEFIESLPKTATGKIQRYQLRNFEVGNGG